MVDRVELRDIWGDFSGVGAPFTGMAMGGGVGEARLGWMRSGWNLLK